MVEVQARTGLTFCCRCHCSRIVSHKMLRETEKVNLKLRGCSMLYRSSNANYGAAQMSAHHPANEVLDNSLYRCQLSLCMLLMPQHAQSCHTLCCCIQLLSIMILILMVRLLPALHSRLQINTNKIGNRIKDVRWHCQALHMNHMLLPVQHDPTEEPHPQGGPCTTPSSLSSTHARWHSPSW